MTCELCGREGKTTEHHLVPRARRKKEKDSFGPTADLCRSCHNAVHATFENKRLARELNTAAKLRKAPELQKYLNWIRKQKVGRTFRSRDRKS